jgi:hypothetical protein
MDISIRTAGTEAVYGGNVSDSGSVGKNNTIDARALSLNFDKENYADTKRANARRQAMSLIGNAWDSDTAKSKKIQNLDEQRASLAEERRQILTIARSSFVTSTALTKILLSRRIWSFLKNTSATKPAHHMRNFPMRRLPV